MSGLVATNGVVRLVIDQKADEDSGPDLALKKPSDLRVQMLTKRVVGLHVKRCSGRKCSNRPSAWDYPPVSLQRLRVRDLA